MLAVIVLLAGCHDPYGYPYYYYHPQYQPTGPQGQPMAQTAPPVEGPTIAQAPPEPVVEDIPPAPYDGAVWCDGYWWWGGTNYSWVGGRYLAPPRPGFFWYPGGYVRRGAGYLFVSGRWAPSGWHYPRAYTFVHSRPFYYRSPVARGWSWRRGAGSHGGRGGYGGGHGGGHGGHGGHGRRR
jgi:hypothetical protein